jgi:hypothetical protein
MRGALGLGQKIQDAGKLGGIGCRGRIHLVRWCRQGVGVDRGSLHIQRYLDPHWPGTARAHLAQGRFSRWTRTWLGSSRVTAYLVMPRTMGMISTSWTPLWRRGRPARRSVRLTPPEMTSRGMESIQAPATGVIMLVAPGPGRYQGHAKAWIVRVAGAPIGLGGNTAGLLVMTGDWGQSFLAGKGVIQVHGAAPPGSKKIWRRPVSARCCMIQSETRILEVCQGSDGGWVERGGRWIKGCTWHSSRSVWR